MNKHCYKVIFSRTLNRLVVVFERARSRDKSSNRNHTSFSKVLQTYPIIACYGLKPLYVNIILGLGLASLSIHPSLASGIVADAHAPRKEQPTIIKTNSGVTQININTPSAKGVSMNQYNQFDVSKQGAVLANNRKPTQAHIAGWIDANPNMARGEAELIVNQINSNNPSRLNGYIEIAGKRADLIIANPSGININGGGILNANQVTLTTGALNRQNGDITGYNVAEGKISIRGQGLDVRDTDYTSLLSRSAEINANIYKGDGKLDVITGVNQVDAEGNVSFSHSAPNDGRKPTVAIDTGELGGMYAGSIRLIATEEGVGVNNAGQIQANKLTLSADGKLSNSGVVAASSSTIGSEELDNSGTIVARKSQILSTRNIQNSGEINGFEALSLNAVGMNNRGNIRGKQISFTAKTLDNAGAIEQTGNQPLEIKAYYLDNSGNLGVKESTSAHNSVATDQLSQGVGPGGYIKIEQGLTNTGKINAAGEMALQFDSALENSGKIEAKTTALFSGTLHNHGELLIDMAYINADTLTNSGTLNIAHTNRFDFSQSVNNSGEIAVSDNINWHNLLFDNSGTIYTNKKFNLDTVQINNAGTVSSNQAILLASTLRNRGNIQANTLTLKAKELSNTGKIQQIGIGGLNIHVKTIDNQANALLGKLSVSNATGNNSGISVAQKAGEGSINITNVLTNVGEISAKGDVKLTVDEQLSNKGNLNLRTFNFNSGILDNRQGTIIAEQMSLAGSELNNNYGTISASEYQQVRFSNNINNQDGKIIGQKSYAIWTNILENTQSGIISSEQDLSLHASSIVNDGGILAEDSLGITTARIDNQGKITAKNQQMDVLEQLDNRGVLYGEKSISILGGENASIENGGGVQSQGTVSIRARTLTNVSSASLYSGNNIWLKASQLITNSGSIQTQTGAINVDTKTLTNNEAGEIFSRTNLSLDIADRLTNSGTIKASKKLDTYTETLSNSQNAKLQGYTSKINVDSVLTNKGEISALNTQYITTNLLDNQNVLGATEGQIFAVKTLSNQGQIVSKRLAIDTTSLDNTGKISQTDGIDLILTAKQLNNKSQGIIGRESTSNINIASGSNISNTSKSGYITAASTLKNTGTISTGGEIDISAKQSLVNAGKLFVGKLKSTGQRFDNSGNILATEVEINATNVNQSGSIDTEDLEVNHVSTFTNTGNINAEKIALTDIKIVTNGGKLLAEKTVDIKANNLSNNKDGFIKSQGNFYYSGMKTDNHGKLLSGGLQTFDTNQFNNTGLIASQGLQTIKSNGLSNQKTGEIDAGQIHWQLNTLNNAGMIVHTGASTLNITSKKIDNENVIGKSPIDLPNQAAKLSGNGTTGTSSVIGSNGDSKISIANKLTNTATGYLISNHDVNLTAKTSINNQGQIAVKSFTALGAILTNSNTIDADTVSINAHHINNNGGLIVADNAEIKGKTLKNMQGTIGAKENVTLKISNGINNNHGQLLSKDSLSLFAQQINNQGGKIQAAETTKIITGNINNRGGDVYGNKTYTTFTVLDNRDNGRIAGKTTLDLAGKSSLRNAGGELVAGKALEVSGKGLTFDNGSGHVHGQEINIDIKSLHGDSNIQATRNLGIHVKDSLNITSDKIVNEVLDISSDQVITNHALLSAGQRIHLKGSSVDNDDKGQIISDNKTHIEAGKIDNAGLINSNGVTHLDGKSIFNAGTGRIYGDQVGLEANQLTNAHGKDQSGVIAARQRLDIGAKTIINNENAEILSEGSLHIGGHLNDKQQAVEQANRLKNEGGLIEAKGNGNIAVKTLNNLNSDFVIEDYLVPEKSGYVEEYGDIRNTKKFIHGVDGVFIRGKKILTFDFFDPKRGKIEWLTTDTNNVAWWFYNRSVYRQKITQSVPGKIHIGGDFTINGNSWVNDKSQIVVGGIMKGNTNDLITNTETKGKERVEKLGTKCRYAYGKGSRSRTTMYGDTVKIYDPAPTITTYDFKRPVEIFKTNAGNISFEGSKNLQGGRPQNAITTVIKSKDISFNTLKLIDIFIPSSGLFVVDKDDPNVLIKTDDAFAASATNHQGGGYQSPNRDPLDHQIQHGTGAINEALKAKATQRLSNITDNLNTAVFVQGTPAKVTSIKVIAPAFSAPYLPAKLENSPALRTDMHKRIGDGYYEQRLIQDQITQLTGRRFAAGFSNDLEQYKALINSGAEFASQYGIKPGVALTTEQMKNLTTDLVWLENQTVTLPDGSQQVVTVPKVYLKSQHTDVNTQGALISAKSIDASTKTLINEGTIATTGTNQLTVDNADITGTLSGNQVLLNAKDKVDIHGGTIKANQAIMVTGKTVSIATTTSDYGDAVNGGTVIDRIAGLSLNGEQSEGVIAIGAKQSLNTQGAYINNASQSGKTLLYSETGDVNIGTVSIAERDGYGALSDRNHRRLVIENAVGSNIDSKGDVIIAAKGALNIQQGNINSSEGAVGLRGDNGVNITEGRSKVGIKAATYDKSRKLLSSKTSIMRLDTQDDNAISSNITGKTVNIQSGKDADINIQGSNVISDHGTSLVAGHDVNITAAQNTHSGTHFNETKKTGLFSSGGIGFTIGKQQISEDQANTSLTHTESIIGNLKEGNTTIIAGENYTQVGSMVNSLKGDVDVLAKQIEISSVKDTYTTDTEHKFKQSGLTVSLSVPVVEAAKGAVNTASMVGKSKNSRVNAMAAANAARTAYEAGKAAESFAQDPTSGISLSVSLGSQKSQSESHTQSNETQASTIQAGGKVNLTATGKQDSSIHITGSKVAGDQGTHLEADHDIILSAAEERHGEQNSNQSKGGSIGFSVGAVNSLNLSFNRGKGQGNGESTHYHNSQIGNLHGETTLEAGNTLSLKGAQIQGESVKVQAQNLDIISRQDTATYDSKQKNRGGSLSIGTAGASVGVNLGNTNINADHLAVDEQSGILAGDKGFDIHIDKHTNLVGGIITSTVKAEAEGKNSFSTGTISTKDLANHSEYDAKGKSVGINLSSTAPLNPGKSIGYGKDGDSQHSITESGIGTNNITLTDTVKQTTIQPDALNSANLTTTQTTEAVLANKGKLFNHFDKDVVQDEIDTQVEVSKAFDVTTQEVKSDLRKYAQTLRDNGDEDKAAQIDKLIVGVDMLKGGLYAPSDSISGTVANALSPALTYELGQWAKANKKEGSAEHIAAHALLAALSSEASGNDGLIAALSAGGSEKIVPMISSILYGTNNSNELTPEQKDSLVSLAGIIGTAIGASTGNIDNAVNTGVKAESAIGDNQMTDFSPRMFNLSDNDIKSLLDQQNYMISLGREGYSLHDAYIMATSGLSLEDFFLKQRNNIFKHKYVYPTGEIAGGAFDIAVGIPLYATCETGFGCIAATYITTSGSSRFLAGIDNFGNLDEHTSGFLVEGYRKIGIPNPEMVDGLITLGLGSAGAYSEIKYANAISESNKATHLIDPIDLNLPTRPNMVKPSCFTAGTPITTKQGHQSIENISISKTVSFTKLTK